jgi:hypothetical protein
MPQNHQEGQQRRAPKHAIAAASPRALPVAMTLEHPGMSDDDSRADLGFTYRSRKDGTVEVLHRGRVASTLRGSDAADFLGEVESASESDAQQLMARITGNYKHGNERLAGAHPRNRR